MTLKAESIQFGSKYSELIKKDPKKEDDLFFGLKRNTNKKKKVSSLRSSSQTIFQPSEPLEVVSSRSSSRSNPQKIPYPERIPPQIKQLRKDCTDYMETDQLQKYVEATKEIDRLSEQYKKCIKQKIEDNIVNKYSEDTSRIQKDMVQQYEELMEERNQKLEQMKESIQQLQQKHNKQIEEFMKKWHSNTKMRSYNRTSNDLRVKYLELDKLKESKRFDEMKYVQAQIDERLAFEQDRNEHQLQYDFKDKLNILRNAQAEELKSLQQSNRHKLADFDYKEKQLLELYQKRMAKASVNASTTNMSTEFKRAVQNDMMMSRSASIGTPRSMSRPPTTKVTDCKFNAMEIKQPNLSLSLPKLNYSLC
ncbi:hypothetical protein TVAG_460920 [Trichomonas vaginalis G3]|uniref:Uncharacterized protein n=1 Tax=Trichomonas vaginalis (strain ATCC PRA-98 / G3) TaxID=412133 RepID=A2DY66_TRIV3|nr:hypothetical protein TVAGG3_0644780 [Trichomonas vaginalis G3]EAY14675.1 hypothetical protein TVAG_460920 [Trichomonas vaginalis G3]KAI5505428.1 hypothetical protein TVAGG3_0644780 [Trichomonas vaginalis G3]|eukprot:XP_001326898.1 hypothetical protein [Trichomonas vaginalis G3]